MKIILLFSSLLLLIFSCKKETPLSVSSDGEALKQFYLSQDVEQLWLDGHHVDWQTGIMDDPNATSETKSHCSAFVASVCKRKGIYILRPPEHTTFLLANAQYDWLFSSSAVDSGWVQITDNPYQNAQTYANNGKIVVAVYKNPNPDKSGHIAFIMPYNLTTSDLSDQGPMLIQAGEVNSNYIPLKEGFKYHISNWSTASSLIKFFFFTKK